MITGGSCNDTHVRERVHSGRLAKQLKNIYQAAHVHIDELCCNSVNRRGSCKESISSAGVARNRILTSVQRKLYEAAETQTHVVDVLVYYPSSKSEANLRKIHEGLDSGVFTNLTIQEMGPLVRMYTTTVDQVDPVDVKQAALQTSVALGVSVIVLVFGVWLIHRRVKMELPIATPSVMVMKKPQQYISSNRPSGAVFKTLTFT